MKRFSLGGALRASLSFLLPGPANAGMWLPKALICLPLLLAAPSTHATLLFGGIGAGKGAGIGSSNVVLTIQHTATEGGCVGWSGTADVVGSQACQGGLSPAITGGNEKTGNSQTQTRTVGQTGVQSGSSLVVILNVTEPGGIQLTVANLSLSIFAPTGTVLFNSGNGGAILLNSSLQRATALFTLDVPQAALVNPFLCTNALISGCADWANLANVNNRIGLSALLTNTQGGNETFSVADTTVAAVGSAAAVAPVPEPASLLLLGAGLVGLGLSRRRVQRSGQRRRS